jgi:hypothetical protein
MVGPRPAWGSRHDAPVSLPGSALGDESLEHQFGVLVGEARQPHLALEQRQQRAVGAGQDPQAVGRNSTGAPNSLVRRWTATSNCIGPTAASTGSASFPSGSRSTCTTPSSSSWEIPRRNCLKRAVSVVRATLKYSGANDGMGGNSTGGSR